MSICMHFLHPWTWLIPALLQKISTFLLKWVSQDSYRLMISSSLVTSHLTKWTFSGPNFSPNSLRVPSPVSSRTSDRQTFAPSLRSLEANAFPSPWPDPVMTATLPCRIVHHHYIWIKSYKIDILVIIVIIVMIYWHQCVGRKSQALLAPCR